MIDSDLTIYYATFAFLCVGLGVAYIRARSLENTVIATQEFRLFQGAFVAGYAIVIFAELLASASFFHTVISLSMTLEQATRLYLATIVSSTFGAILLEIADLGARRDKCILCAILYCLAMLTMFSGSHYEMLMLGRVIYGLAAALQHNCFEAYAVHTHTSHGYPEDWLTQTFSLLTHSMALVSVAAGVTGQATAEFSARACVLMSAVAFSVAAALIALWEKDVHNPRFTLQGFLFHLQQSTNATRSNPQLAVLLACSALFEASTLVFTFYWAPWLSGLQGDESTSSQLPFELIFASFACSSLLGNYGFQILLTWNVSVESILQSALVVSSIAFFLGALFQTVFFSLLVSLVVQASMGLYWPAIGHFRGRLIVPELRNTILLLGK
jgi:MFS family permease